MRRQQAGVSLIEVLVAVIVFSIGLLGLAALQMNALRFNEAASVRGHAIFLASEMADRIRARPEGSDLADFALDYCEKDCEPAMVDHEEWVKSLQDQLPAGQGSVAIDDRKVTITVRWSEERLQGDNAETVTIVTRI